MGVDQSMDKSYCELAKVADVAAHVYDSIQKVPLICAKSEEKASAVSTFFIYASGTTVLDAKALVGLAMNEGKPAAWDRIKLAAEGAMKAGMGNTLLLAMRNGAPDLVGIAKETGAEQEKTLESLFTATKDKPLSSEEVAAAFPALGLEAGDCKPDFRTYVVSEFLEEDIEEFFQWVQIPLESCHLVVVED